MISCNRCALLQVSATVSAGIERSKLSPSNRNGDVLVIAISAFQKRHDSRDIALTDPGDLCRSIGRKIEKRSGEGSCCNSAQKIVRCNYLFRIGHDT